MGGKDVVCVKQLKASNLTQSDVQAQLKKLADDKFSQEYAAINVSVLCSVSTSPQSHTHIVTCAFEKKNRSSYIQYQRVKRMNKSRCVVCYRETLSPDQQQLGKPSDHPSCLSTM